MPVFLDGLDETDQKIVKLLIRNARMSYSDIGKQIGLSRVAVKLRVQALEQKGIIEGYTTIIDPQKISGSISCYIELETAPGSLQEVCEILNQEPIVTQIYRVTGRNRLHVHALAASHEEMEKLIVERSTGFRASWRAAAARSSRASRMSRDCGCKKRSVHF